MIRPCDCDFAVSHNREGKDTDYTTVQILGNSVHSGVAIGPANHSQINLNSQQVHH